jgi:hypothetical protein
MTTTIKVLGQAAPAATTNTDLYTVPAATSTVCSTLMVANRSEIESFFRVAVRPAGATLDNKHYVYYNIALPGGDAFAATLGVTLAATDVVTVYSSSANLSFSLFGEETT